MLTALASCPTAACLRSIKGPMIAVLVRSAKRPIVFMRSKPAAGTGGRISSVAGQSPAPAGRPEVEVAVTAAAAKFAGLPPAGRWPGQIVVALFGEEKPITAPAGA